MSQLTRKVFFFILLCFSPWCLAEESSQNAFIEELRSAESKVQETSRTADTFYQFVEELPRLLSFLDSEAKREYFLKHEVHAAIQKIITVRAQQSFDSADSSLKNGIALLGESLSSFYPKAGVFMLGLHTIARRDDQIIACQNKKEYPLCVWQIALASESSNSSSVRIRDLISQGVADQSVDPIRRIILLYVEAKMRTTAGESSACASLDRDIDLSHLNNSDEKDILNSISDFSRVVTTTPVCKNEMLKKVELVAKTLCSAGRAKTCIESISIMNRHGVENTSLTNLKKSLVVSATEDESRNIARSVINTSLFLEMNLSERLKVFLSGMLPLGVYLGVFAILVMPIFLSVLYFLMPYLVPLFSFMPKLFSRKSSIDLRSMETPQRLDEYSTLLQVFDLPEDATGTDIKKAYRAKMKQLHPDANKESSQEDIDRVQEAYDRLMHLRRSWYGTDR